MIIFEDIAQQPATVTIVQQWCDQSQDGKSSPRRRR